MKTSLFLIVLLALFTSPAIAQTSSSPAAPAPGAPPSPEEMAKMMELGKPGDNHKLLASMAGDWTYTVKMWMDRKRHHGVERHLNTESHYGWAFLHRHHSGKIPDARPRMAK